MVFNDVYRLELSLFVKFRDRRRAEPTLFSISFSTGLSAFSFISLNLAIKIQ